MRPGQTDVLREERVPIDQCLSPMLRIQLASQPSDTLGGESRKCSIALVAASAISLEFGASDICRLSSGAPVAVASAGTAAVQARFTLWPAELGPAGRAGSRGAKCPMLTGSK